jgi:hypothetical protein
MKDDLTAKKGFRSRKPEAMTNVERQRKWRRKNGGRGVNFYMSPEIAASVLYLRGQWGMETTQEVVDAALRFLTICTRQGLQRLPQSIDD